MFETIFYQPVLNLMVLLYDIIPGHDLGIVIIVFSIIIKLLLYPLSKKALEGQKALQSIQPKLEEIKQKYKDDREALGKAQLELYKEEKINPFSSCLPLLIQLPFLYAVFRVFRNGFANGSLDLVYSFIPQPEHINTLSLGFFELSNPNNIILAVLAGVAQFYQGKMMMAKQAKKDNNANSNQAEDFAQAMNKQMMFMMPLLTAFFAYSFPSGLALYWFMTTLLTIIQQYIIFNTKKKEVEIIPPQE